jgi:hypothetical protein
MKGWKTNTLKIKRLLTFLFIVFQYSLCANTSLGSWISTATLPTLTSGTTTNWEGAWYPSDPKYVKSAWTHVTYTDSFGVYTRYTSYKYTVVKGGLFGEVSNQPRTFPVTMYQCAFEWEGSDPIPSADLDLQATGSIASYSSAVSNFLNETYAFAEVQASQIVGVKIIKQNGTLTDSTQDWAQGFSATKGEREYIDPVETLKSWRSINASISLSLSPSFTFGVTWENPHAATPSAYKEQSLDNAWTSYSGIADRWVLQWIDKGLGVQTLKAKGSYLSQNVFYQSKAEVAGWMTFNY